MLKHYLSFIHILLLLVMTHFSMGQKKTTTTLNQYRGIKYALIQSRDYKFKLDGGKTDSLRYVAKPFVVGQPLYPIVAAAPANANGVYIWQNNRIKVYYFEGGVPNNITPAILKQIDNAAKSKSAVVTNFVESRPICFGSDSYSRRVMQSGVFTYKTISYRGGKVTIWQRPTDNIPLKPYYFDLPTGCQDTTLVKQLELQYKGPNSVPPSNIEVESFWFDQTNVHRPQVGVKQVTQGSVIRRVGYMNIALTQGQINYIMSRNGNVRMYYKLKNNNTRFTLNIKIGLGCNFGTVNNVMYRFICPTDPTTGYSIGFDEEGQPDPTQVGIRPPN